MAKAAKAGRFVRVGDVVLNLDAIQWAEYRTSDSGKPTLTVHTGAAKPPAVPDDQADETYRRLLAALDPDDWGIPPARRLSERAKARRAGGGG